MSQIPIVGGMTQEEPPPRRMLLRGALAMGCGLLVPAALFGCGKKESDSGAMPESAPPTGPGSAPDTVAAESAAPAAKVSQASVQYQTQPKGDQQCSGCMHFIAESNTCKLVEGQISPNGWCTLWTKKT